MRGMASAAGLLLAGALSAGAADVHIGIDIGVPSPPPPPIAVPAPPELVVVPSLPVYYAPGVPYNFFYYDGLYYVFHDGYWFSAASAHGPWIFVHHAPRPILAVPVRYYKVRPGHWKKHGPGRDHDDDDEHGHGHGRGHRKHHDD